MGGGGGVGATYSLRNGSWQIIILGQIKQTRWWQLFILQIKNYITHRFVSSKFYFRVYKKSISVGSHVCLTECNLGSISAGVISSPDCTNIGDCTLFTFYVSKMSKYATCHFYKKLVKSMANNLLVNGYKKTLVINVRIHL